LPAIITFFVAPFLIPLLVLWLYVSIIKKKFFLFTFSEYAGLIKGNMMRIIGTFISTLAIQWIALLLMNSFVIELITNFVQMNLARYDWIASEISFILPIFIPFLILMLVLCFTFFGSALLFFSIREINEANSLKSYIEQVGFKKRAYGLEQE
jgi:hypothetical protein